MRSSFCKEKSLRRVVYWGTYDTGKPRNRIMIRGLKENGVEVIECHANIWQGVEDKSQISGLSQKMKFILSYLLSYPILIYQYLRAPCHDVVIVGYMGQFDVLVLWLFAKLRRVPIVWDVFLSLYNTAVEDRNLVASNHPLARFLFAWEWTACRAANILVLDTQAHADYFTQRFKVPPHRTGVVFVGAETTAFPLRTKAISMKAPKESLTVLFYGQFIPLHGIETIIRAAQQAETEPIQWILIGRGQMESKIRDMLQAHPLPKLKWIPWVPYEELVQWIHGADICLGIFGNSDKAARVIPNKIFQILSSGKPLITRDSPAIRELLSPEMPGVFLVPPATPTALAYAIRKFAVQHHSLDGEMRHWEVAKAIEPTIIASDLIKLIKGLKRNPIE